jgi:hypothetical protein
MIIFIQFLVVSAQFSLFSDVKAMFEHNSKNVQNYVEAKWSQWYILKLRPLLLLILRRRDGPCILNESIDSATLLRDLEGYITAQPTAFRLIRIALDGWSVFRFTEYGTPLVMAFTGPVGIGKSDSAVRVAKALLKVKPSGHSFSRGILVLQGSDYANPEKVGQYHERIHVALWSHFKSCRGVGVVIFDEVQKVVPGTLDILTTMMHGNPHISDPLNSGAVLSLNPSNLVFIFISDIGKASLLKKVLEYNSREDIPDQDLEGVVRVALDKQWARLSFGRYVDAVIPFLPMEPPQVCLYCFYFSSSALQGGAVAHFPKLFVLWQIADVAKLMISKLASSLQGKMWKKLHVDPALHGQVALPQHGYITYHELALPHQNPLEARMFARHGARNVNNGGPVFRLRSHLARILGDIPDVTESIIHVRMNSIDSMGSGSSIPISIFMCTDFSTCVAEECAMKDLDTCHLQWSGNL